MGNDKELNSDLSARETDVKKLDVIRAYWAAESAKDFKKMMTYFTDDIVIKTLTSTFTGNNNILKFYDDFVKTYSETSITIINSIEEKDQIAVEWTGRYVRKTGEKKLPKGCHVFAFMNDKICKIHGYFNPNDF